MSTPRVLDLPAGTGDGPEPVVERTGPPVRRTNTWARALRKDWQLYSLVVLPVLFLLIFRYLPMIGNIIAFRRYLPGGNLFGEEWVGLTYFELFLDDPGFWRAFTNTLILGALTLLFLFPLPIVLALLLNEVRTRYLKRFVQTISYMPHFLSIVVVAGIIFQTLSVDGIVNQALEAVGGSPVSFLQEPGWFRTIYISSEAWQTVGWGTILYLAALTTIDPDLYEAARIDGASRWQQTWHVTLPGIRPTIVTLLVLNTGTFMAVGFEKILLIYNPLTYETGDVIATYVYRMGVQNGLFSYATAIGMFEAVIGLVLVYSVNLISRRTVGTSLW